MSSAARVSHAAVKLPASKCDSIMFTAKSPSRVLGASTSSDALLTSRGSTAACLCRATDNSEKDSAARYSHDPPLAQSGLRQSFRLALGVDLLDVSQLITIVPGAVMMSVQDWSETWRETTGYPNEIQAIEALALLLDGKVSAPETAKTITMTYERSIRAGMVQCPEETVSITDSVTDFWEREMCDAIRTFGNVDTHERLMDLLVEISRQPDILDPRGRQVMHAGKHGRDSVYWSGVPGWESALVALGLCTLSHAHPVNIR